MKKTNIKLMVILSLFLAIEIIFCFTPLGSLPITPLGIKATLAHIPVITAAILLDKKSALFMGLTMGTCSFIVFSTTLIAEPSAFAFTPLAQHGNFFSIIICFFPRILCPLVANLVYNALEKKMPTAAGAAISAVLATMFHSAVVLSLIYIFFSSNSAVSEDLGATFVKFIIAWGGLNAIMEIIVAGIICGALAVPLKKAYKSVDA